MGRLRVRGMLCRGKGARKIMRTAEQLERELRDFTKRIRNMREDCRAYKAQGEEIMANLVLRDLYGVRELYKLACADYRAVTGKVWS